MFLAHLFPIAISRIGKTQGFRFLAFFFCVPGPDFNLTPVDYIVVIYVELLDVSLQGTKRKLGKQREKDGPSEASLTFDIFVWTWTNRFS